MAGLPVQASVLIFTLSNVLVPTISQAIVDGRCTLVKVLAVKFDKSLDDHVLASYPVEKEDDCQMKCFRHKFCVSYNLGPVVDNGVRDCEISKSDEFRDPQNVTDRPGYIYRGTENSCSSGPCPRNASCIPNFESLDNFQCVCPSGFTGETCAIDVNECQEKLDNCHFNANCSNTVGSFECFCKDGFTGNGCYCADINECEVQDCHFNAECINTVGSFECPCKPGYKGDGVSLCEDIDECQEQTHNCHLAASCHNTLGSFGCVCKAGYAGDGQNCTDINECDIVQDCHFNGECINTAGSFHCSCKPGYKGDGVSKCKDIDECQEQTHNCDIAARCHNTVGSFSCVCEAGFTGNGQNCTDVCFNNAVGVADQSIIPDRQITATSYLHNDANYQAAYGRLHDNRGDGWCAMTSNDTDDWLQVDLGDTFQVCAVATQGDGNYNIYHAWVTAFKLSHSFDGNSWETYKDENAKEMEFHRQGNNSIVDQHRLPVPVATRYVRFHPTQQHVWNCLRVEVYSIERPPTFKSEPMSAVVEEREDVTFTCWAHGVPMPNITWSKENGSLPVERSVETQESLLILNVLREDSGIYTCNATNTAGSILSSAELLVHSILKFTDIPYWGSFFIFIGDSLTLPCSAESDLQPTLTWIIPYRKGVDIFLNNTLFIASAELLHNGSYICEAQNNLSILQIDIDVHVHVLPTCQDIKLQQENKNSGMKDDTSGTYTIDPDGGDIGEAPFEVFCNMTMENGRGVTVISHDSEARTLVDGFDPAGSYSRDVSYTGATLSQIVGLISVSAGCRQFIKYECFESGLLKGAEGWWVSRDGSGMKYWGGAPPGSAKCACGVHKKCVSATVNCNCDAELSKWLEDSGYLTDQSTLPVTQLRFGDTGQATEKGYHTLGKLMCYGRVSDLGSVEGTDD